MKHAGKICGIILLLSVFVFGWKALVAICLLVVVVMISLMIVTPSKANGYWYERTQG